MADLEIQSGLAYIDGDAICPKCGATDISLDPTSQAYICADCRAVWAIESQDEIRPDSATDENSQTRTEGV